MPGGLQKPPRQASQKAETRDPAPHEVSHGPPRAVSCARRALRLRPLAVATHSAQFLKVLEAGSVATNVFLRRIHNFALDMSWLPWPVLAKKQ